MTAKASIPRPPKNLGTAGRDLHRRIWADLGDEMELSERERTILALACTQVDRGAELEAAVDRDGLMVAGSTRQLRVNPAVGEARQAALAAGRLLSMLALPDGEDDVPRTAAQVRAKHASAARWGHRQRGRRGSAA
jgi:P27 family predicted phage terminase small subunit